MMQGPYIAGWTLGNLNLHCMVRVHCCVLSCCVTRCYTLHIVIHCYTVLHSVTHYYTAVHSVTQRYTVLHSVTQCYTVLYSKVFDMLHCESQFVMQYQASAVLFCVPCAVYRVHTMYRNLPDNPVI